MTFGDVFGWMTDYMPTFVAMILVIIITLGALWLVFTIALAVIMDIYDRLFPQKYVNNRKNRSSVPYSQGNPVEQQSLTGMAVRAMTRSYSDEIYKANQERIVRENSPSLGGKSLLGPSDNIYD